MDGNRRYATGRGLSKTAGHRYGLDSLYSVLESCDEKGIEEVSVYAFSTENWKRSEEEVSTLLSLMETLVTKEKAKLLEQNAQIHFIGDLSRFSDSLQQQMNELVAETADKTKRINICISYGGRAEIVAATKQAVELNMVIDSEEDLEKLLWSHGMTDPQLVIRTGGNQRLSNFLLWKCAYSEIIFTDTLWPEYSKEELEKHIDWYHQKVEVNQGK